MKLGYKKTIASEKLVLIAEDDIDREVIKLSYPEYQPMKNGNMSVPYSFETLNRIREIFGEVPEASGKGVVKVMNLLAMERMRDGMYEECLEQYNEIVQPYLTAIASGRKDMFIPKVDDICPLYEPLNHQWVALSYMHALLDTRTHHALFFEQGTGKTFTSLVWAEYLREQGLVNRILIVSPLFAMFNAWGEDIEKFTGLSHEILWNNFSTKKKWRVIEEQINSNAEILLINREGLAGAMKMLSAKKFDMVIVDESWAIKSHSSRALANVIEIGQHSKFKMILNGTPMPKGVTDLWAQFKFLDNGLALDLDFNQFKNKHMQEVNDHVWIPRNGSYEQVSKEILPYSLAFKKKEVLDLPPRRHFLLLTPMHKVQRKLYDDLEAEGFAEYEGHEITYEYIVTKALRLRQIISGFDFGSKGDEGQGPIKIPSSKYDAFKELAESIIKEPYFKVVVWICFKQEAARIAEVLSGLKQKFAMANSTVSSKKIMEGMDKFKKSKDVNWMIAHPLSIGSGVNLQESNFTVMFSLDEDLKNYLQLLDRNHRATSERPVTCYYIVAKDSYDEKIIADLRKKEARQDLVVHGFSVGSLRSKGLRDEWRTED